MSFQTLTGSGVIDFFSFNWAIENVKGEPSFSRGLQAMDFIRVDINTGVLTVVLCGLGAG